MKLFNILTIVIVIATSESTLGQTALIYPTVPGANLRDYSQPGVVAETKGDTTTFYPTIPGTNVRDYFSSTPGIVARTDGDTTTFYPTLLSSGVPDYFSSSTSGFAARTSGDTTSFYPTIPGTGVRDYFNPTPSFAARTSGDTTTFYPTIPQTGVRDYFSSSPTVLAKTSGDTITFYPTIPGTSVQDYSSTSGNSDQSSADMFRIGYNFETGSGVEKDYSQAMQWFQKAAAAGNSNAMNSIGGLYLAGWGVPQNYPMAVEYTRAAADAGNGTAMYNMGIIFEHGIGEGVNLDAAITWYRMAAAQGIAASNNALARLNASVIPNGATPPAPISSVANPQSISPQDVIPDAPKPPTDSEGYPDQPGDVAGKTYQEARPVGAYQWSDLSPQEQAALTRPGIEDPAGQFNQMALQSQGNPGLVPTTPKTQMLESEYGLPITTGPVTDMTRIAVARGRMMHQASTESGAGAAPPPSTTTATQPSSSETSP